MMSVLDMNGLYANLTSARTIYFKSADIQWLPSDGPQTRVIEIKRLISFRRPGDKSSRRFRCGKGRGTASRTGRRGGDDQGQSN